jgi:uncharacterized membrane protein
MPTTKWRGGQVTRIEALTDAVFGFAITFLFVSFDVPTSYDALLVQLRGFIPFAACFALLILVWMYHYKLFGRFDLDDGMTMFLNSVLLFVVLFYIYPLKFVFTSWLGGAESNGSFSNFEQLRSMMTLYAAGYIAVFAVFGLLYFHAYRMRQQLELAEDDVFFALEHLGECMVMVTVGFVSILVAQTLPLPWAVPAAGFSYMLIGPAQWYRAVWMRQRRPAILARTLAS